MKEVFTINMINFVVHKKVNRYSDLVLVVKELEIFSLHIQNVCVREKIFQDRVFMYR